jgi:hypothetical protein
MGSESYTLGQNILQVVFTSFFLGKDDKVGKVHIMKSGPGRVAKNEIWC